MPVQRVNVNSKQLSRISNNTGELAFIQSECTLTEVKQTKINYLDMLLDRLNDRCADKRVIKKPVRTKSSFFIPAARLAHLDFAASSEHLRALTCGRSLERIIMSDVDTPYDARGFTFSRKGFGWTL